MAIARSQAPNGVALIASRTDRRQRLVQRQGPALAGGASLQLDHPLGQAARADDQLPGQADEVHGGELAARTLVRVVVQRLLAGGGESGVGALAGGVDSGVAGTQADDADA